MARRLVAAAVAGAALLAPGCGDEAATGETAARAYGGPLEDPGWRKGEAMTSRVRPPAPGTKAAGGMAVLHNRGTEPAVIDRASLVGASRNIRLSGIYTADERRAFIGGDSNVWPAPPGDYAPGSVRRAPGTVVPPLTKPGGEMGTELVVVVDLPRAERQSFRAIRVDYHVGAKRYWIEAPYAYGFCTPRKLKCPEVPRHRSPRHGG